MYSRILTTSLLFVLLLGIGSVFAQSSLTGTVEDKRTGEPLPGATIILEGADKGTASDIDGNYTLNNIEPGEYTIIVSFVGFKRLEETMEIELGSNEFNAKLSPDISGFDEVVVTGVSSQTQKKKLAFDVSSVSDEQVTKVQAYDISDALTGKIAGARIVNNGAPGAPASINLRGINTMGNSRPMILVDGVQIDASTFAAGTGDDRLDALSDLDLGQIERVEVVKGAAAATLYGAQGANGVINIFTKAGQPGELRVSASTSWNLDVLNNNNQPEMNTNFHNLPVNSEGQIIGMAFDEQNGTWQIPGQVANGVFNKPYTSYVDANTGEVIPLTSQDERLEDYYLTGVTGEHKMSISGGNDKSTFLVSGSFLDQESVEQDLGFDRLSLRINSDTDLRDDLKLGIRTNFVNSDRQGVSESGNNIESGLSTLLLSKPFVDVFRKNPNGSFPAKFQQGSVASNPLFQKQLTESSFETNRFIGSLNLNYSPTKYLELDYRFGTDYSSRKFDRLQRNALGFEDPNTAEEEVVILDDDGFFERIGRENWQFNSIIKALVRTDLQEDLGIGIPVTSTTNFTFDWRRNDFERTSTRADGLPFGLDLNTLSFGNTPETDEFRQTFITFGFLVNQNFEVGNYMGFSGGFRADKSSAFGEAAEFNVFPRGDVFLRLSELGFMKDSNLPISELKIRGAYGEAGIQPGAFDRFVTLGQDLIGDQGVFNTSGTLSNPRLQVEESREFEAGGDIEFQFDGNWFQNIGLSGTYWSRETDGAIQSLEVEPSRGSGALLNNALDLSSQGVDLSLNGLVYFNNDFTWRTGVQFGRAITEVDDIANGEDLTLSGTSSFTYRFSEGDRFGVFTGFRPVQSVDAVDPSTGERFIPEAEAENFTTVDGVVVNRFTKRVQFRNEKEKIGDPTPDFTLTFRNDFTIKDNWDISFQLEWQQGGDIFNATKWWMFQRSNHEDFEERVLIDGGEQVGGNLFDSSGNPTTQTSTVDGSQPQAWANFHNSKINDATPFFVEDATYLKLREVSVSYDFTNLIGAEDLIRGIRVGFSARNVFTITDYDGFDPEVSGEDIDSRLRGLDIFTFPNIRTFSFKASIDI